MTETNNTLQRIQTLADLANGVQNPDVLRVIKGLPAGDALYQIFVTAVSNEIELLMNPNKEVPKSLMDAVAAANGLKSVLTHLYAMVGEINRSQVMGMLGVLNQKLGGRSLPAAEETGQYPTDMQPQERPDQGGPVTPRTGNTGLSW